MDTRDASQFSRKARSLGGARLAWHALALLLAIAVAGLVFAAYRQPDFILDFAGVRLC